MNIFQYLHFVALSLRYPSRRDYLRGGVGILERYHRCRSLWDRHLRLSSDFIQAVVKTQRPNRICILGAGRLLDVPILTLSSSAKEVTLIDCDPGALASWRAARKTLRTRGTALTFGLFDVTGRIDDWTAQLLALSSRCTETQAEDLFMRLTTSVAPAPLAQLFQQDLVISLNLLSQIPLYWEDRVRSHLSHLLHGEEPKFNQKLEQALQASMQLLQREHLDLLVQSNAHDLVLLTDEFFHYYTRDVAAWRNDPALLVPLPSALPGYSLAAQDSWLWHIAPQGIEREEYGEYHTVRAFALRRQH